MIKKTSQGYMVQSRKGKALSQRDLTIAEAQDRLRQVEYFKHHSNSGRKSTHK